MRLSVSTERRRQVSRRRRFLDPDIRRRHDVARNFYPVLSSLWTTRLRHFEVQRYQRAPRLTFRGLVAESRPFPDPIGRRASRP